MPGDNKGMFCREGATLKKVEKKRARGGTSSWPIIKNVQKSGIMDGCWDTMGWGVKKERLGDTPLLHQSHKLSAEIE